MPDIHDENNIEIEDEAGEPIEDEAAGTTVSFSGTIVAVSSTDGIEAEVERYFSVDITVESSTEAIDLGTGLSGSVVFGYQGVVDEDQKINFSGNWTGDAIVTGSGDAEKVLFESGQYLEMIEAWNIGDTGKTKIDLGKYEGIIGALTMKYKTGPTQASCEAATWATAVGGYYTNDGWFMIRLEE